MMHAITASQNFPPPERAGLSHMERRLPPPCGEVGLLSAHARRRPGGGLELALALRRLDVAQCFERSSHPARLCAVAQEARRLGPAKGPLDLSLIVPRPHKGEVSSRRVTRFSSPVYGGGAAPRVRAKRGPRINSGGEGGNFSCRAQGVKPCGAV